MELGRRDILRYAAWSGVFGSLGLGTGLGCGEAKPATKLGVVPASLLRAGREEQELTLDLRGGRLPTDLEGHWLIIAPLPWGDGTHCFSGDGILYDIAFGQGAPRLRSRIAKTPCYFADRATRQTDLAFDNVGLTRVSGPLGFRTQLNTNVLPIMDGRLVIATDAGRPYEVDPLTLEVVTPVGAQAEWLSAIGSGRQPFGLQLTAAHPFYDHHTREFWNVAYGVPIATEGWTEVLRWDGAGPIQRFRLDLPDGAPLRITQSAHQFAVTEDYLVLMDCASLVEPEQLLGKEVARAQSPVTQVYLVRRADLKAGQERVTVFPAQLPLEAAHVVADYANPGGRITLHLPHLNATDATEWLKPGDLLYADGSPVRPDLYGLFPAPTDVGVVGRYVLDAERWAGGAEPIVEAQQLVDDQLSWSLLFMAHQGAMPPDRLERIYYNGFGLSPELLTQSIVDLYRDHPGRRVPVEALRGQERPSSVFAVDAAAMKVVDGYAFPRGVVSSSPQVLPRRGREMDQKNAYLSAVVYGLEQGDELWIFDAAQLSAGPICRLGHRALDLPYTLHTNYLPALKARASDYRIDPRADYEAALSRAPEKIRALFEQDVFPHFTSG